MLKIADECSSIAIDYRSSFDFNVTKKQDNSIITDADLAINNHLIDFLLQNFDQPAIISEESNDINPDSPLQFMIDPIDGTRSYASGGDNFAINISVFFNKKPIFSLIHAPLYKGGVLAYSDENNNVNINCNNPIAIKSADEINILTSNSINYDFFNCFLSKRIYHYGKELNIVKLSSSIKFIDFLTEGYDFFILPHYSHEWDVAAGSYLLSLSGACSYEVVNKNLCSYKTLSFFKNYYKNNFTFFVSKYGKKTYFKL